MLGALSSRVLPCHPSSFCRAREPLTGDLYALRRLYGLWLVGFNDKPRSWALERTAGSVRPILRLITPVGVLPFASVRNSRSCAGVQGVPAFRLDLGMFT